MNGRQVSSQSLSQKDMTIRSVKGLIILSLTILLSSALILILTGVIEKREKAETMMLAIEGGVLHFARNQSNSIVQSQLESLMLSGGRTEILFRGFKIETGPGFSEIVASVESSTNSYSWQLCSASTTSIHSFDDGIFPYRIVVDFDLCPHLANGYKLGALYVILLILTVFAAGGVTWFSLSPIASSLSAAQKWLKRGRLGQIEEEEFDEVVYAPVRDLVAGYAAATRAARDQAIARTTQALSHDVRKPFSMLKVCLDGLNRARTFSEAQEFATACIPEIQAAVTSVEGLLQDIMDISSTSPLVIENAHVGLLIQKSVSESLRTMPEGQIQVTYKIDDPRWLQIDVFKVTRVLSNIFVNAMQAMNGMGEIIISAKPDGEFCLVGVKNFGSFIPRENLENLFNAFFSQGKKGGTGLGLAIAKKVIRDHGGRIWCESQGAEISNERWVEFKFTLPADQKSTESLFYELPTGSTQMREKLKALFEVGKNNPQPTLHGITKEAVQQLIKSLQSSSVLTTRVLLVEDEKLYADGLLAHLKGNSYLEDLVRLQHIKSAADVHSALENSHFDIVIHDLDLGSGEEEGSFTSIKVLRTQLNFTGVICVHSNRFLASDQQSAFAAGADLYMPKPMGFEHFLKLLMFAADRRKDLD